MADKIPHPLVRRVAALETHLKLLREALARLDQEPDLYKLLAGELRILVVQFRSNRPLLLDLMNEAEVSYIVGPDPDLPFPIALVDEEPEAPPEDFSTWPPERIWEYHRSRGKAYPLDEFVRRALAVYVLGESYSYEKLIRTLAENSGTSHEDPMLDSNVLELESIEIGGFIGHTAPLRGLASHVLEAGCRVLQVAVEEGYQPHYFVVVNNKAQYPPRP